MNDRDGKDGRSDQPAISSHGSLVKELDTKQRQVRDRAAEPVHRAHQVVDRDDGRREGHRRPSDSDMQHRQERRHSGSHHRHHHHHHHQQPQQHAPAKDDVARHNRHTGLSV